MMRILKRWGRQHKPERSTATVVAKPYGADGPKLSLAYVRTMDGWSFEIRNLSDHDVFDVVLKHIEHDGAVLEWDTVTRLRAKGCAPIGMKVLRDYGKSQNLADLFANQDTGSAVVTTARSTMTLNEIVGKCRVKLNTTLSRESFNCDVEKSNRVLIELARSNSVSPV